MIQAKHIYESNVKEGVQQIKTGMTGVPIFGASVSTATVHALKINILDPRVGYMKLLTAVRALLK